MSKNSKVTKFAPITRYQGSRVRHRFRMHSWLAVQKMSKLIFTVGPPSWLVAERKTSYFNILDARWFRGMFLVWANTSIIDRRNVRRDTGTGMCARKWSLVRRWSLERWGTSLVMTFQSYVALRRRSIIKLFAEYWGCIRVSRVRYLLIWGIDCRGLSSEGRRRLMTWFGIQRTATAPFTVSEICWIAPLGDV